jgi:hypothetical protein
VLPTHSTPKTLRSFSTIDAIEARRSTVVGKFVICGREITAAICGEGRFGSIKEHIPRNYRASVDKVLTARQASINLISRNFRFFPPSQVSPMKEKLLLLLGLVLSPILIGCKGEADKSQRPTETGTVASGAKGESAKPIQVVGFDEHDETLQAIIDGEVHGTVVQNPYMYGFSSVKLLKELQAGTAKNRSSQCVCRQSCPPNSP